MFASVVRRAQAARAEADRVAAQAAARENEAAIAPASEPAPGPASTHLRTDQEPVAVPAVAAAPAGATVATVTTVDTSDQAQQRAGRRPTSFALGIDGVTLFPTGDFGEAYGVGLGALVRGEIPLHPRVSVSLRGGLIQHLPKGEDGFSISLLQIPLQAGVQLSMTERVYVAGEAGLCFCTTSFEDAESLSDTFVSMTAVGGVKLGKLDARAGVQTLLNDGSVLSVIVAAGYELAAF